MGDGRKSGAWKRALWRVEGGGYTKPKSGGRLDQHVRGQAKVMG